MPRQLTSHIVDGDSANHLVSIAVLDEPGQGGAHHQYMVSFGEVLRDPKPTIAEIEDILSKPGPHPSFWPDGSVTLGHTCFVAFQNGPIKEFGVNGITHEALLAIVIDRLECFQNGPFACGDSQNALTDCRRALNYLQNRTRARIARGVEGTHQK